MNRGTSDKGARWRWVSKAPQKDKNGNEIPTWSSRTYERPKTGNEIKGKQAIKLAKKQRRIERETKISELPKNGAEV